MCKKEALTIAALLFVSLLVRLFCLGRCDLWGDEVLLITSAKMGASPWDVVTNYWQNYVVAYGWLPVPAVISNMGYHLISPFTSDVQSSNLLIRLPLTLIAACSPLCVYWLGKQLFNRHVALGAALMTLCFYYPVYYSRELHAYPLLLTLCPLCLALYFRVLQQEKKRMFFTVLLFCCAAVLGYSHYTCSFVLAAIGGLNSLWLVYCYLRKRGDKSMLKALFFAEVALLLAGALIAPLFYRLLTEQSPHLAMSQGLLFFTIINDGVVKMLFGNHLFPVVLAWVLVLLGAVSIMRRRKEMQRLFFAIYVAGMLAVAVAALRTQYVSARYYSCLCSMLYLLICNGVYDVAVSAKWLKERQGLFCFYLLLVLGMGYHLLFVLPLAYRVRDKFAPYGRVARWMNEHIPAGNTFMFEGGSWDFRYIPTWFKTPDLVPAARIPISDHTKPMLRQVQKNVMHQFPLGAYIEQPTLNDWDYPRDYYRQKVDLYDANTFALERAGLAMQFGDSGAFTGMLAVHYNDRDDAIAMAKEAGQRLYYDYTGWSVVGLGEERYAWGTEQPAADIKLVNLSGEAQQLELVLAGLAASSQQVVSLLVSYNGEKIATIRLQNNQMSNIKLPAITVEPSGGVLHVQKEYSGWFVVATIAVTE